MGSWDLASTVALFPPLDTVVHMDWDSLYASDVPSLLCSPSRSDRLVRQADWYLCVFHCHWVFQNSISSAGIRLELEYGTTK